MRLSYLLTIILVFIADQISKWWVVEHMIKPMALPAHADASAMPFLQWMITAQDQMPFVRIDVLPFFNLVMVWNKGVSFGMFNGDSAYGPLILFCVAAALVAVFSVWLHRTTSAMTAAGLVLIIGGAAGNMLDRVRFGAVVDFLDLHAGDFHWPAFNVADSAICIGIALLLIHGLFFETKKKEPPEAIPHDA